MNELDRVIFNNESITFEYENVVYFFKGNAGFYIKLFGGFEAILLDEVAITKFLAGYKAFHLVKYRVELSLGEDAL